MFYLFAQFFPASGPDRHHRKNQHGNDRREPAAVEELHDIGTEIGKIERDEDDRQAHQQCLVPAPSRQHEQGQEGGDDHVHGNGQAVGRCQIAGRTEQQNQSDRGEQQHPVDERNINLAEFLTVGLHHRHAGQLPQLHCLAGKRENAGNNCLRGDNSGDGRENDQRNERPFRREVEEWLCNFLIVGEHQGALAEIVEQQSRQHKRKPGQLDRLYPEMAHVRV